MPIWMTVIEWLARVIFVLLIGLSVWSISIIIDRNSFFKKLNMDELFGKLGQSQNPDRFFFNLQQEASKGFAILGTLGSVTPFVGLLGTILGIIVAFGELSQGEAGTNAIMFALAEALILTAVGLFVAIPAVVSFNAFNRKYKTVVQDLQSRKGDS